MYTVRFGDYALSPLGLFLARSASSIMLLLLVKEEDIMYKKEW